MNPNVARPKGPQDIELPPGFSCFAAWAPRGDLFAWRVVIKDVSGHELYWHFALFEDRDDATFLLAEKVMAKRTIDCRYWVKPDGSPAKKEYPLLKDFELMPRPSTGEGSALADYWSRQDP